MTSTSHPRAQGATARGNAGVSAAPPGPISTAVVRARALAAADALPPTFPIGTFVAANPLHGLEHLPFEEAARIAAETTGAASYLSEPEYHALHASGRIGDDDLRAALLRRWPRSDRPDGRRPALPTDPDVELSLAELLQDDPTAAPARSVRTLTEQADHLRGSQLADAVDAMVATWCAVHLDQGQAAWVLPRRELGLYGAWRALAPKDPALGRLAGRSARRRVAQLPVDAATALTELVARWQIPQDALSDYFRAAFRRLPGWASALARSGDGDDLVGFLALRLALEDLALDQAPAGLREDLRGGSPSMPAGTREVTSIERLAVWQEAFELGYRNRLLGALSGPRAAAPDRGAPPEAQAVFCIDPRSEGMRRHLEALGPYETLGFAGFFGLPVRIASLEHEPVPSCPVIVEPKATIVEVPDTDPLTAARRHDRHDAVDAAWDARHEAKVEPAAPFAFAEAAGWVLGPLAALNTFAPRAAGRLRSSVERRSVPDMPTRMDVDGGAGTEGLSIAEQVRVAHGGLTTMGLTSGFAPLVLLSGHRSATTNNPFAAALDCGACAGKAGGPNARALAEILNHPDVRSGLSQAGIAIPDPTWFVPAEHETTTDTVTVLDRHRVPARHLEALTRLERALGAAGAALADERRALLPGHRGDTPATTAASRRSRDWAEPVPEWGLVRNAAVVVGPRSLTAGLDLQRRVFLHSYDPVADVEGTAIETILTGPLVVGHWISSQYYFSTVDPQRYGAGTKPLHNVVGGIGVHEGPGGDLRTGLPLESVRFAGAAVHEPMRLLAVVQAPRDRMDSVILRNAAVAQLLDNGWIHLVAGSNGPDGWAERRRDGTWAPWPDAAGPDPADEGPMDGVAGHLDDRRGDLARQFAGIMTGAATDDVEGRP